MALFSFHFATIILSFSFEITLLALEPPDGDCHTPLCSFLCIVYCVVRSINFVLVSLFVCLLFGFTHNRTFSWELWEQHNATNRSNVGI